jgi:gas vesicle protein
MTVKEFTFRFGFFVAGATVGAVTAFLTAPKSGKETRKVLSRGLEDGVDFLNQKGKAVTKRVETVLDRGRDIASRFVA